MKKSSPYVFLVSLALLLVMFFATTALIYEDYALSNYGEEATATIERLEYMNRTKQGKETYYHAITFDGHSATLGLDSQYLTGTQIPVTYLPQDPETVKLGNLKNKSILEILSGSMAMVGFLLCLVMLIATIVNFVSFRNSWD